MRDVIIHYHLFKNAGSTIDRILSHKFGKAWVQMEGDGPRGRVSSDELATLIKKDRKIKAVSSHQALLPVPVAGDCNVISIIMLRNPIDRVRSVYQFEHRQEEVSPGSRFASNHSFPDYVRWRLEQSENGVIHNFQTNFLLRRESSLRPILDDYTYSGALKSLELLPFYGLVEYFEESIEYFNYCFKNVVSVNSKYIRPVNVTRRDGSNLEERVDIVREELGDVLFDELVERNRYDIQLYRDASRIFQDRLNKQKILSN